jgi:hypothetical protein
MRRLFTMIAIAGAGFAAACNGTDGPTTVPTPAPSATVLPTGSPVAIKRTVTTTETLGNKDGSTTVVTLYSDGSKSEIRSFKTGKLTRVVRETSIDGTRTVKVAYREDEREIEVKDPTWAEKAMDATGDALAVAAAKTKQGAIEAADKAEDAGDATKKGAREAADKAEDVGDAVKKGAKKTGKKIKDAVTPEKKN